MIGMLLVKNEIDVVRASLEEHAKHFDRIYVLDGSEGKDTAEIFNKHPNVAYYAHENELRFTSEPTDGTLRKILVDRIVKMEGYNVWVSILNVDEVFYDNPQTVVNKAEEFNKDLIVWEVVDFFWHKSQVGIRLHTVEGTKDLFEEQTHYVLPPKKKVRQFYLREGLYYEPGDIGIEHPSHSRTARYYTKFDSKAIVKHYPFSTDDFIRIRALFTAATESKRIRQISYSWLVTADSPSDMFVDIPPRVPGEIEPTTAYDFKVQPLPITYP